MSVVPSTPLTFFSMKDGHVESTTGQELVDAYAADFQGLRHFGSKIGDTLNLGEAWTGTLQEEDLTVTYAYAGEATGPKDEGHGALIGKKALLFDILTQAAAASEA